MCCGVSFEDYAVMGARALRQQSADFEVWLKRALRHGDASLVETLHVSCISKSLHLLSTGLLNRRRSRSNHHLRSIVLSSGLQHKREIITSHSRNIQETVASRNIPNTASTHDHVHVLLDETICECLYSTLMTWPRRPSLPTRRP